MRGLLVDKNQQLVVANNLITNIQNLLGLDDLNNLPLLPEGETLNSLLGRPTSDELRDKQNEIGYLEREKMRLENKISEKDKDIGELNREKNEIQRKLEEIKNKKRDWRSFYDWIGTNVAVAPRLIMLSPGGGNIRRSEVEKYGQDSINRPYKTIFYQFFSALEATVNNDYNYSKERFPSYNDNKTLVEMLDLKIKGVVPAVEDCSKYFETGSIGVSCWNFLETMLSDWKKDASLRNTAE